MDGVSAGRTPLELSVKAGTRRVLLRSKELGIHRELALAVPERKIVLRDVTIGTGAVKITTDRNAKIYIDGKLRGESRFEDLVYEGRHELRVVSRSGDEKVRSFSIRGGESKSIQASL